MEDSEVNVSEQPEPEKPAVTEEIILHPANGAPVKRLRGEGGKFQKQPKAMPKSLDVTRLMRNLMLQPADPNGKLGKKAQTRIRQMFDNVFAVATMSPEQPVFDRLGNPVLDKDGNPLTVKDAKIAMASVQAFKELMLRTYGTPSKSEEELDAMKKDGVKIVIIAPPEMVNRVVVEEKPREQLKPAFIDGEFTTNK